MRCIVEFVWACLIAFAMVFALHFGMIAYDCHEDHGTLVAGMVPFTYVCVRN
jgi:hypothetical protein